MVASSSDPKFLTLAQIAGWQIATPPAVRGDVVADLPALQRGAIWRVRQIEELWDSILRGFPIGAFTISPPDAALGRQNFKYQSAILDRRAATHLLLDGQQRATAIALGFDAIWARQDSEAKGALWIDISEPPKENDRQFILRVLTRSHPWGYSKTNPGERLGSAAIRAALRCFEIVLGGARKSRSADFALHEVWPWDAVAPVPVALVIQAVTENPDHVDGAIIQLQKQMSSLPLLRELPDGTVGEDQPADQTLKKVRDQQIALRECFEPNTPSNAILRRVVQRFHALLSVNPYQVPALVLHMNASDVIGKASDAVINGNVASAATDDVELLFIRLNASGTALSGEELIYSLIKARWPEVAQWMQDLPRRPALPSRIAAMCVRLVLARQSARHKKESDRSVMPTMPSMADFRRQMSDDSFSEALKTFLECDAERLFSSAWAFLALPDAVVSKPDFRLLPTQVVDLAQRSPDVFLLLLRWLDRLFDQGISVEKIEAKLHRRTLGFLTAIAWFAPDKEKACAAVWRGLQKRDLDDQKLLNRFNSTRFNSACQLDYQARLKMIPLPSPEALGRVSKRFIGRGNTRQTRSEATVFFPQGGFWTGWNWWYEQFAPALAEVMRRESPERFGDQGAEESDDSGDFTAQAAWRFLQSLHGGRETVLVYAQRASLHNWYPAFDPSLPESIEDSNRPWDWDHILPESLIRKKHDIPPSVKWWISSVGNLRAWPFEANRSDGNTPPVDKMNTLPDEDVRFGFKSPEEIRQCSFVSEFVDWPYWKKAVPTDRGAADLGYLSNRHIGHTDFSQNRIDTVSAIALRFCQIYGHWYKELRVGDLN
ncbi:DUF262 domain-containing protein [Parafrankia sp. BMG5.11]|uniref:DUF262 domain-containing protein n=1 Tax=Parafrankia sp. BMG5.11 TaxID=222540 RepID=UPI00103F18DD|nr:DUF262 domain-containing protein [Parafrankia sp. BMG5.11]TCJ41274.1 DUF262 domain-containing protein [Parafrankia sp. BMG5.11]